MTATFPKSERLCSKLKIEALFANGDSYRFGGFTVKLLRIHTKDNDTNDVGAKNFSPLPKLLISVPKRYQKKATDRNRTKRLVREVYRKQKTEYLAESNIDALAIIYTSSKVPDYAFAEECLLKLFTKIK